MDTIDEKKKRLLTELQAAEHQEELADQKIDGAYQVLRAGIRESARVADVAENTSVILNSLDKEFEQITKLNATDFPFLFFAVALQCTRWFFQPKISTNFELTPRSDRHDAGVDGTKELKESRNIAKENQDSVKSHNKRIPSVYWIYKLPVPYDAMVGTQRIWIPGVSEIGKNLYGGNHHSATMGHDPIMGYIFGTLNILTRSITFKNPMFQTCEVHLTQATYLDPDHRTSQVVTVDVGYPELIRLCIESLRQDPLRLPAAIGRHVLHMQSDKFCKDGLPIPFVSAERAQALLKEDWNSEELKKLTNLIMKDVGVIGLQGLLAALINVVIQFLHKLSYREESGISREAFTAKTHKILYFSNMISSSSNVIYSLIRQDLTQLDIGGICVTLWRMYKDENVIHQLKQEFIYRKYYELIKG